MVVAGIDIGAFSGKTVLFNGGNILSYGILPIGDNIPKVSRDVTEIALDKAGLNMEDVEYTVGTGSGRITAPFAHEVVTDIICHATAVKWEIPDARTIIDIGGWYSKIIKIDENGIVEEFSMNDEHEGGTGLFLEVMDKIHVLEMDDFVRPNLTGRDLNKFNDDCTFFSESELVPYGAKKKPREDIIADLHKAAASRIAAMARQLGIDDLVVFSGGVAKNLAIVKEVEEEIGHKIVVPEEPQIMGAVGAALIAMKRVT